MKLLAIISLFCFQAQAAEWFQADTIDTLPIVVMKSGESRGTVILAHGCSGPAKTRDEGWASRLQDAGFNTVQFDSWAFRRIPGGVCTTDAVTGDDRVQEVKMIIDWLKTREWHSGPIFLLGWSHGGSTALMASTMELGLKKVVAMYPWCAQRYSNPKVPTQVHIGAADDWTPPHLCKHMYGLFTTHPNGSVFIYPNATHDYDRWVLQDRWYEGRGAGQRVERRHLKTDEGARDETLARVLKFFSE